MTDTEQAKVERPGEFNVERIIAAWRAAHLAANEFEPTANLTYERGWFKMETAGIGVRRYRRFDIEDMTAQLNRHALATAPARAAIAAMETDDGSE